MKKIMKKIVALIACLALSLNLCAVGLAANTKGVTFSVSLDNSTLSANPTMDQTVTMTLSANKDISVDAIGFTVTYDDALTLTAITKGEQVTLTDGSVDIANGVASWYGGETQKDNIDIGTEIAVITFTVPAGTVAGNYNVGVEALTLSADWGTTWESGATASTTLTVQGAAADGYSAGLNVASANATLDSSVIVNVAVSHKDDTAFAAGEITVSYDTTRLQFNQSASTLGGAACSVAGGVITLVDYGADKNFGTSVYSLLFTTLESGNATVTMTSAAFADKTDAETKNLISATITNPTVTITIAKRTYSVTLPDIFTGAATATDGEDYTFSAKDTDNYNYGTVTATMDGAAVTVIDNGDGTYTIKNVTGALVITGSRTAKTYTVTFEGTGAEDVTDGAPTATYGEDYTFTIPTEEGYAYSVSGITIGGVTYTGYSIEESVCKIAGADITGNIVITITKTQTTIKVTVTGTGAGAAGNYATSVEKNEDYVLTLTPEKGYVYTVTATMGGNTATVIVSGNTYTVEDVTAELVFTVERTPDVSGTTVQQYLTLDGTIMWLVLNTVEVDSGKVWSYGGEAMYWSETYGAYCCLVVADTLAENTAKAALGIISGTAVEIDYGKDVNMSGTVDANDAQLTYNMYNTEYADFSATVTMEKFLRADVNGDKKINTSDAAAIVGAILA